MEDVNSDNQIDKDVGIIYEDEDVLVIDKPSGMTVNRADTTKGERTVQEWVEERILGDYDIKILGYKNKKSPNIPISHYPNIADFHARAGIVHRLDKETSGIMLIAKTPQAFAHLQKQFKERTVKKIYTALVHGKVVPQEGEINVPVGRLPWNRKRFGVLAGGREAMTKYKTLSTYTLYVTAYTLLALFPQTGRTHQIRVHLKYLGFPIVGDPLYGGRKQSRDDRIFCPRLFLHAGKITFIHPATNQERTFESILPLNLQEVLTKFNLAD